MRSPALIALPLVALLSACAIGPDYQRQTPDLPSAWQAAPTEATASVPRDWWKAFNDPVLNQLVDEALAHNQNLHIAMARVDEARALLTRAHADQLPQLSAGSQYQRGRGNSVGLNPAPGRPLYEGTQANGVLSFELDLWGKYRRASEAARAELLASRYNQDTVALTLISQVAQTYFALRAADQQQQVAENTLTSRQEGLKLHEKRFRGGYESELDFRQAEADAAVAQASLASLQQQVQETRTALAVLVGQSPKAIVAGTLPRGKALADLTVPPTLPAGLPSDLLVRRPDLQAAEHSLIAANARIGVARAAYLPNISLTGLLGSESTALSQLFSGPAAAWSFAASLAMPIFDFGKTGAGVDAADARQRQALAQYQWTIQTAFKETQDALVAIRTTRESMTARQQQVVSLKRSLRLAQLRYNNGYSNYLEVLDAERGLFQAQLDAIRAQNARLSATVTLVKALGGGWGDPDKQEAPVLPAQK